MPADEIDPALINLQRALFAAQAAVRTASERPGRTADWTEEQRDELAQLRQAEREAVMALTRAREEADFTTAQQRRRLEDAAREG